MRLMKDLKLVSRETSLLLTRLSHFLTERGIKSYLIGGFVRDLLLGRDTADIDIALAADALEVAPQIAKSLGGKYVLLDEVNGIGRVVVSGEEGRWELDFTTLKGDIEQDLAQRDFTIDAMAIDLEKIVGEGSKVPTRLPELIDPFQGWHDLQQGVVRAVSEAVFASDPARLLRAVRLAAELGFRIDPETESLIQRHCQLIGNVAGERLREEFLQLLALPRAGQLLTYLDELGLLTAMIPELARAKGVEQLGVHLWDVFNHSLKTVVAADFLFKEGSWEYVSEDFLATIPWSAELSEHFNREVSWRSTRKSILKLAALLHDIGKPQTKTIDETGRIRFLGHAREGAVLAAGVLERLRFSTKEIKLVEVMVEHHLRPKQMGQHGLPSRRAIYRYFRDTQEAGIDILFLSLADHLATRGPHLDLTQWQEHTQVVEYVLVRHFEEKSLVSPPKLVDGHDLINIFGLSPGPRVGQILEAVREAQAAGEVTSRKEALAYIEHLLSSPLSKE
jgi:poly(A) polymerase